VAKEVLREAFFLSSGAYRSGSRRRGSTRFVRESAGLCGVLLLVEQIRAVAECFLEGHALAPLGDLGVVAADQDFRTFPPAEVSRASVVREIEHGAAVGKRFVERAGRRFFGSLQQAEGLVLRRGFIAESARKQAGHGIENQSSG